MKTFDPKTYEIVEYKLNLKPGLAVKLIQQEYSEFYKTRHRKPSYCVLGFDTYANLCRDLASDPAFVPRPTMYLDMTLIVNDTIRWDVQVLPSMNDANPRFVRPDTDAH